MGKVADVTDRDFDQEVLQATVPTIIDFWAEWCAPCRQIKPIVEDLASRYDGKIKIVKLNVDENPQTSTQVQHPIDPHPARLQGRDRRQAGPGSQAEGAASRHGSRSCSPDSRQAGASSDSTPRIGGGVKKRTGQRRRTASRYRNGSGLVTTGCPTRFSSGTSVIESV